MSYQVIESIVMPGGWHKPEIDRLGREMQEPVRASTYQALIEAVTKFRADNVIPIGDVKDEIDEYICTNFPHMCHSIVGADVTIHVSHGPRQPRSAKTLTDEMIQTMDQQLSNHSSENLELRQEAQRRADICRKCQYNVRWNNSCGSCVEAVNRMSTILRSGQDVVHSRELRACQILKHENRSAVWMRLSGAARNPDLPQHCWAKR
jgi:hypothetical protein